MALGGGDRRRGLLAQAAVFVLLTTLVLTAAVLGLVGLLTGAVGGLVDRLPFYALATAVAFLGAVVTFEAEFQTGRRILTLATTTALGTLVLVGLGGEGVAYVVQHPASVASTSLVFYVLSAGLVAVGLGVLGFRHWEELAGDGSAL